MRRRVIRRAATLLLALAACGGTSSAPVTRRLDGEIVPGHFVSPTSYEAFVRGELALEAGDCAAAVESFRLATADAEDDALATARLVRAYACAGSGGEARRTLERGIERFPLSESLWLEASALAEREGDAEGALSAARRARACSPSSFAPALRESDLLRARGETDGALGLLREFAETRGRGTEAAYAAMLEVALVENDSAAIVTSVGHVLSRRALSEAERSRVMASLARVPASGVPGGLVRTLPGSTATERRFRVEVALALDMRALARDWLAEMSPSDLGGFELAARLSLKAGDAARATTYAELALAESPSAEREELAGDAAFALGEYASATAHYTNAMRLGASDARREKLERALDVMGLR